MNGIGPFTWTEVIAAIVLLIWLSVVLQLLEAVGT